VSRVERLRGCLDLPLLVTNPVNVRYLTGFRSTNAALLVEPERVRLFTDFRYADAARAVPDVEVVETRRNLYADLAGLLSGEIGFEPAALTVERYETLRGGGVEPVAARAVVEELREVKEPDELDAVRRAAAITNEAYTRLAEEQFVGRTERELARWLAATYLELGADAIAFEIGLGAGPTSAVPHAKPGERRIDEGTLVLVDSGASLGGYQSDCTRTFATRPLRDELARVYEICLAAQERALEGIRPGVGGREADDLARALIADAGFGERFGHGLGHGLGLEVHEGPYLNQESDAALAAGNVVTVEPGIYLSGVAGVRIEDLVIVTESGVEVLTTFPKELVTVR
jgi:Xaa-Pro aminopeptidase